MPGAINCPEETSYPWLCHIAFSLGGNPANSFSSMMYSMPMIFAPFVFPSKITHWMTSSFRMEQ
ncbi:hypothetical protein D3C80_2049330 [compost metagenome]